MSPWMMLASVDWSTIAWCAAIAVILFVGSIAVVALLVVHMPANYFVRTASNTADLAPVIRWTVLVLKNILGIVLIILGFVMLVTPGQGILTMLFGVALVNFPGKRNLERKLISQRGVLRTINRLRQRYGKPPIELDERKQG